MDINKGGNMSKKQNRSIGHHHVPRVLQKQFCANKETEQIWYSRRKNGFFTNPKLIGTISVFLINDQYTVLDNKHEPSDIVEREHFGKVDNYLGRLLLKIPENSKFEEMPKFTGNKLDELKLFVFEMFKRSPDIMNSIKPTKTIEELIQDDIESGKLSEEKKLLMQSVLKDQKYIDQLDHTARVRAMAKENLKDGKETADAIQGYSIRWAVSDGEDSFILTSRMVHINGMGGVRGISNPKAEIWMSLTPKIALVLVKDPKNEIPLKVPVNGNFIRDFNEFSMADSDEIASHSQELLESLIAQDTGQSPSPSTGG